VNKGQGLAIPGTCIGCMGDKLEVLVIFEARLGILSYYSRANENA
jgi:hypothetical protein